VNATAAAVLKQLSDAGLSPATLARVAGVQRSTALRWTLGAQPRKTALERLAAVGALLDRRPELSLGELGRWLDQRNVMLGDSSPASWIRDGRDPTMVGDAWAGAAQRLSRRATASTTNDLERVVGQLLKAEKAFAGLDLAPLLRAASGVNVIARQVDMVSEIARTSNVLQAASIATQLGPIFKQMNDSVRAPLGAYLDIAQRLPRAEIASAFAGMTEALSAIRASEPVFAQVGLLARLAADSRPPIGALALGMDLQLSSAFSAALTAAPNLRDPFMTERITWRAWLPVHPSALTRTTALETEWLVGETHNAAQASVAAIGRAGAGVDQSEVNAALTGVTADFPNLLDLKVPGTSSDLRTLLGRVAPAVLKPLQGAVERLSGGGADDARQASASLRAALDELANQLVPGPKNGRDDRYAVALRVAYGDPDGKLLHHQIGVLYATYAPLSAAVHDELDIEAVRAHALGMFSAMAAVMSRWMLTQPGHGGLRQP